MVVENQTSLPDERGRVGVKLVRSGEAGGA